VPSAPFLLPSARRSRLPAKFDSLLARSVTSRKDDGWDLNSTRFKFRRPHSFRPKPGAPIEMAYSVKELAARTFAGFEALAEKQGGCWCMYYQRARPIRVRGSADWKKRNEADKKRLVAAGRSHAVLVYDGARAIGWCQYGPAEELPRIDAGRFYRKFAPAVPNSRLWRITCFFVDRAYRRKGVATVALEAALESIKSQGGGVVEAFPVVSKRMAAVPEWLWFGTPSMFEKFGFRRIAPLGSSRELVRLRVLGGRRSRAKSQAGAGFRRSP
jgi:GNAT superfamily N-acetyltransferase